MGGVYCLRNRVTGEGYIGSTRNFRRREKDHFNMLARGKHYNPRLQASYVTHGRIAFEFVVIEPCSNRADLGRREMDWQAKLRPAFNEGTRDRPGIRQSWWRVG